MKSAIPLFVSHNTLANQYRTLAIVVLLGLGWYRTLTVFNSVLKSINIDLSVLLLLRPIDAPFPRLPTLDQYYYYTARYNPANLYLPINPKIRPC